MPAGTFRIVVDLAAQEAHFYLVNLLGESDVVHLPFAFAILHIIQSLSHLSPRLHRPSLRASVSGVPLPSNLLLFICAITDPMSSTKAEEQYSTNPSTIKARRRKMKLDGADKVEDAAKTADYKSMVYARKVVQSKPEYQNATSAEKSDMLERAMHDTMEKRYVSCNPLYFYTNIARIVRVLQHLGHSLQKHC